MNKLALSFVLLSITFSVDATIDEVFEEHAEDCLKETGSSKDVIQKLLKHDFDFTDTKMQCFTKCVCVKSGACDKNMNLNVVKLEEHAPAHIKSKIEEANVKCADIEETDPCVTVFKKFKCLVAEVAKPT